MVGTSTSTFFSYHHPHDNTDDTHCIIIMGDGFSGLPRRCHHHHDASPVLVWCLVVVVVESHTTGARRIQSRAQ